MTRSSGACGNPLSKSGAGTSGPSSSAYASSPMPESHTREPLAWSHTIFEPGLAPTATSASASDAGGLRGRLDARASASSGAVTATAGAGAASEATAGGCGAQLFEQPSRASDHGTTTAEKARAMRELLVAPREARVRDDAHGDRPGERRPLGAAHAPLPAVRLRFDRRHRWLGRVGIDGGHGRDAAVAKHLGTCCAYATSRACITDSSRSWRLQN